MKDQWGSYWAPAAIHCLRRSVLGSGERFVEFRRGHGDGGVGFLDAEDELAGVGVAGDDGGGAGGEFAGGVLAAVEPEVGFAGRAIGSVAGEAVFGQDGPDVAVVARGVGGLGQGRSQLQECENEEAGCCSHGSTSLGSRGPGGLLSLLDWEGNRAVFS